MRDKQGKRRRTKIGNGIRIEPMKTRKVSCMVANWIMRPKNLERKPRRSSINTWFQPLINKVYPVRLALVPPSLPSRSFTNQGLDCNAVKWFHVGHRELTVQRTGFLMMRVTDGSRGLSQCSSSVSLPSHWKLGQGKAKQPRSRTK